MNYNYEIMLINEKERWIYINHKDWDDDDGFVNLVKSIQNDCNGKIVDIGDVRYKIEGSDFDLIYQWDSCFGTVVIYPNKSQKEPVTKFLESYFEKLNK